MSDYTKKTASQQEADLLENAEEIMEKSAAVDGDAAVPAMVEFTPSEPDRFEERPEVSPDEEEEEEEAPTTRAKWGDAPSVRNQMLDHPSTVRLADPETKILDLSKPADLKEYNRIQKAASDEEAPTLAITEVERQQTDGSWTALITFHQVQYQQL